MEPTIDPAAEAGRKDRLEVAAGRIVEARLAHVPLGALESWCRPVDEGEGNAVQQLAHALLTSLGRGEVSGRKIGCTTKVMQQYLGIPNPCAGGIFLPTMGSPTLIADDFFNAGCVLGTEFTGFAPKDLGTVTGRMEINGVEVGSGIGTDVLGHPLEPLRWLATAAARNGNPLRAGEFVMLGSLVQTHWLERGDSVRIFNEPFGEVAMHLD